MNSDLKKKNLERHLMLVKRTQTVRQTNMNTSSIIIIIQLTTPLHGRFCGTGTITMRLLGVL